MNKINALRSIGLQRYSAEFQRILLELSEKGFCIENAILSEISAEALIIAVAAMIEENNKVVHPDFS